MKQLLFLLLFPCLALAQYTGNGNQKISLGEQTTADGLVFRGVASIDTVTATSKITRANKQDTSAFLLLDTVTNLLWHYKTGSNGWIQAGGSTFDTTTLNLVSRFALKLNIADTSNIKYVNTYGTQTVNGLKTFTDTVRIEDAIKVGANNAYVYSAGTGNYYFTKDYKNQSGLYHIGIGNGVLSNATTVSNPTSSRHGSVAIGFDNLKNLTQSAGTNQGVFNTSIGYNNMSSVTTGGFNTSIGAQSLKLLTTGGSNVAIGTTTLENMTTGGSNLGIGDGALRFLTRGEKNVAIGSNAGVFRASDGEQVTSIDSSIYIGQRADPSGITGVTNEIAIGFEAKGQGSNSVTFGNTSTTKTILNGNVGIGTTSPTEKLHVVGNGLFTGNLNLIPTSGFSIMTQQSPNVSHGITGWLPNNAYSSATIEDTNNGGFSFVGATDAATPGALNFYGIMGTTSPTSNAINFRAAKKNGTTIQALGAAENAMVFNNYGGTDLLQFKGNGDAAFGKFIGGGTTGLSIDNTGTLVRTSSFELKKDIVPIHYGLNEILQLNPINFNWVNTDKYGDNNENGFIAEDVMSIIPNSVNADSESVFMDYSKLIPILTKAIQEQQILIKALEQRILILENK